MKNELILDTNPKSSVAEAIRIIRTNLQFSSADKEVKTILVTSSIAGEGKSFTSSNLAIAFAQNGKRVLLIDFYLRRGRLHKIFGLENDKGLSNLLISDIQADFSGYLKKTNIKNLFLLSSGSVPPNPSELLDSRKNKTLIQLLSKKFDYVIFDGTPVGGLTDSVIMSKYVDKVVIVCAINYTKVEQLVNTQKTLENIGADIAGVIVNKIPESYSSYYGSYYGHYYQNE